jgi:hypothetical protein
LVVIFGWAVGCTQLTNLKPASPTESPAEKPENDLSEEAQTQIDPTDDISGVSSCGLGILGGEARDSAIREAMANAKVQGLQQELASRGYTVNSAEALAFSLDSEKLVYLPAGETAGIVYETYLGQGYAVGAIRDGDKTVNIRPDKNVRHITGFDPKTRAKLFKSLRSQKTIKTLEKNLKKQNQRLDWNRSVLIVNTEESTATVGLAVQETNSAKAAWFGYRVDALVKGKKLVVQQVAAEACGTLAALESVQVEAAEEVQNQSRGGSVLPPQPGRQTPTTNFIDDSTICVSSWGYSYRCFSTTPEFGIKGLTTNPLIAFVGQSVQTSFTIWNYSGKTLSGTATASAPFSIVSGGTFTLAPGQPQQVTMKFSPTASGNYTSLGAVRLTSGTIVQNVALKAWTLTVSPARLDFKPYFLGAPCPPQPLKLPLPSDATPDADWCNPLPELTLTVKNDGPATELASTALTTTASVTVGLSGPFSLVSATPGTFQLKSQQTQLLKARFKPTASGTFSGAVQLASVSSGLASAITLPLTGTGHKVSVSPRSLEFGLTFVETVRHGKLIVKNEGTNAFTLQKSNTTAGSPLSFALPANPYTLAPGASIEIQVQFSPVESGDYIESLEIVSGAATLDIKIGGVAMTVEELLRRLKEEAGYPVLFTESTLIQRGMLFAGFDDLDLSKIRLIEQMYRHPQEYQDPDAEEWRQVQQGVTILKSLDTDAMSSWLSSLERALSERGDAGFQEEFDRLYSTNSEFVKLVAVVLLLQGRLQLPPHIQLDGLQQPLLVKILIDIITKALTQLALDLLKGLVSPAEPPSRPKDAATWILQFNIRENLKQKLIWDSKAQELWKQFEKFWDEFVFFVPNAGKLGLSFAIYTISYRMVNTVSKSSAGCVYVNCNLYEAMTSFAAFLEWSLRPSEGGVSGIDRLEQAIGTLYSLSLFAVAGWHIHGFPKEGNWVAGLAYLPAGQIPGFNQDIIMVIRGDHCIDCAAKIQEIIKWVTQAIAHMNSLGFNLAYYNGDERIITLVFTNSNATGIPIVLHNLGQTFSDSTLPIVVLFFEKTPDGNYTIQAECTGSQSKCEELKDKGVIEKIRSDFNRALQLALAVYTGTDPQSAWFLAYGVCNGDADCIRFFAQQIERWLNGEIGPPPPPECGPKGCDPKER